MHDMKRLSRIMRELEDQLVVCMRCGMCQSVCPLFAETGRESDVARGKLALLDGLIREMLKDPRAINDRLTKCLLCGSCAANCPSGVKVIDIFLKARVILGDYMGLSPLKKALFRGTLARPDLFNRLVEWGSKLQSFFVKPVDDLLGTSCARFMVPLGDRHVKRLAAVPFHAEMAGVDTGAGASGLRVAFFTGCLIDKVFPEVGKAVLRSLEHHGVSVFVPEDQGCCGLPALSSGDSTTFMRLVRHNGRLFGSGSFDHLVTACASCTATIKKIWPMMAAGLAPDELSGIGALAEKTMDISQFLADRLGVAPVDSLGIDEKVTLAYHDPCHLKKSLGISVQPRAVMRANPKVLLKEMADADRCCGCGGSFNVSHYEISAAIGKRKRESIVLSGCSVVATSCPACMLQISDMLSQAGDRVRVRHAIEIYAESLDQG